MNEKQIALVIGLQDRIDIILKQMDMDPFYALPRWSYENIWNTLEAILTLGKE